MHNKDLVLVEEGFGGRIESKKSNQGCGRRRICFAGLSAENI